MIGSGFERRDPPSDGGGGGVRMRVYELAKELGVSNKDLVNKIRALGIEIANHMSHLEPTDVDRVRRALDRERHETLIEQRLSDTVIRRRSRTAAPPRRAAPRGSAAPASAPAAPPGRRPRPAARGAEPEVARPAGSPPPRRPPPPAPAEPAARREPEPAPAPPKPAAAAAPPPARRPCRPAARRAGAAASQRPASRSAAPPAAGRGRVRQPAPRPAGAVAPPPVAARAAPVAPRRRAAVTPAADPALRSRRSGPPRRQRPRRRRARPVAQDHRPAGHHRLGRHRRVHPAARPGQRATEPQPGVPRIEIKDRDEELRRLGRTGLLDARHHQRRPLRPRARSSRGQRPGGPPRKKVVAAGKKVKQTQITTPAEHKRVIKMGEAIAVVRAGPAHGRQGQRGHQEALGSGHDGRQHQPEHRPRHRRP